MLTVHRHIRRTGLATVDEMVRRDGEARVDAGHD
jgi:hypothetical protein